MKNFTNKFKQFTSRLSARWLIMVLMILVETSSAWAANSVTSDGNYRLYFKFSGGSTWWNGSGCYHYAWIWANGGSGQIQRIYKVGTTSNASTGNTTDVFYLTIPNGMKIHGLILFRGKNAGATDGSTTYPDGNTYSWHNKTNDITLPNSISTYNLITAVTENSGNVTQTSRYTSVSPSATTLTASGYKSGSGTQADPYVYDENSTMKLSASATIDDHNFSIQLAYGSSTATITSGNSNSIDVALTTAASATAYTVTYTPLLGGSTSYKGTASTETIYYKTENPCPTLTTGTVSGATTICSGEGATVSLSGNTAGSTIQWQKSTTSSTSGFANISGATNSPYTANNLTQTTYFRAVVTLPASGNCSAITQNTTAVTVTVRATPTKYDVTVGSADNKVKLSNSQTNYTYTLYKDGTTVSNSSKTGSTGTALEWTVSSAGTYTVKAKYTGSACTETLMNGSYTYTPCVQTATEGTGSYSNGTITLSAKFNTCGNAYIGFQWKEEGDDWCYEDNNSNPCFIPLDVQNKQNAIVTKTVAKPSGKSYVFRPYIVVGNDAKNWLYGTEFTVGTCTLPIINSTDAEFNKNNFADFAALYVTDCSGKEITGYQWYKDGEEYESKCEYTTKDGVVTGDAGQTNNIRPKEAGNYTCKVTYMGGTSATSAAFAVNATSGTTYADFKSNLPVIMVNTGSTNFPSCPVANETASKHAEEMKEKLSVDVRILSDGKIVYDRKARMAYRGSSSLNFLKKSYAFCPGDANCGDAKKGADYVKTAKLNMLGIGEAADKDWVLYAAAADPSMLRNRIVFETYQAMRPGEWGVKSRYVELIINGEYKGVYLMMDKITQNKKRVNVEWSVKDETKRGFILKFDKTDVVDRSKDYPDGDEKTFLSKYSGAHNITTYDAKNDQAFEIEYPEKGDIEDEGGNWYDVINFIQGMINNFETALSAGEYQKVQQIIDYESWADWFILSEYTKNVDAFRASCVFVYDGTKLKATPLWDQELSFNNQSVHANRTPSDPNNKGCENVTGLLIKNDKVYSDGFAAPFWFTGKLAGGKGTEKLATKTFTGALLNDPCFVQMVKNRWEAHKTGALSNASLTALITNYEKELTSAVRTREANFWNGKSRNTLSCPWPGHNTGYHDDSYEDAKADITAWISDAAASGSTGRRAGLSTAIDALKGTGLDIAIKPASIQTTPWVPVVIQVQNETGYEYTLTYTDGELDKQPNIIIEKSGDTYKYHIPRPAKWTAGNELEEGERTDISYGIKATLQVGEGNNQCGSKEELPSETATIVLQDELNEICQ